MSLSSWFARKLVRPVALDPTPSSAGKARSGVKPPQRQQGPYAWSLAKIREARDQQMRGCFSIPVRLAEAFRTDDALFTAYQARVATQSAIALTWQPSSASANTRKSKAALKRAQAAIKVPQHVRQSILGTMANHGLAIGYVEQAVVDTTNGPTVSFTLTEWPLEFVRYIVSDGTLETRVKDGGVPVKITHGDGRWVVFAKFGVLPWTQDACLLPAALLWAAHAEGLADWAGASAAHGQPRVIGELPDGITLGDGQGGLSPDAQKFLELITDLINGDAAAGIRPFGAKTDWIANTSTAWQVFLELINNREGAAAKIYLGTDAILGARGGAPGVDVAALFGIATTRIQGDLEALERGFAEGVILPWCALHGVAAEDAPRLVYELPDVDKDKRSEQEGAAITRLADAVDAMKRAGLVVDQDVIDALTKVLGVSVSCVLTPEPAEDSPEEPEPEDGDDPEDTPEPAEDE